MISLETERQIRREWALRAERMQPAASPYHPDYGLPQDLRITILRTAEQTSPATAAKTHNVAVSTIYRWRKVMREA
jgi:hypothetical protein